MKPNLRKCLKFLSTVALLAACEVSVATSTAHLSGATMTKALDPTTRAPTQPTKTYSPSDTFIGSVLVEDAPPNTEVNFTIWELEGRTKINGGEVAVEGSRWLVFRLEPEQKWAPGQYELKIELGVAGTSVVPFTVTATTAS